MDEAPPWEVTPDYENLSSTPPIHNQNVEPQISNPIEDTVEIKPVSIKPEPKESDSQELVSEQITVDPEVVKSRLKLAWHEVVPELGLSGRAAELIKHCLLDRQEDGIISLSLDKGSEGLLAENIEQEIKDSLCRYYNVDYRLELHVIEPQADELSGSTNSGNETPAQRAQRKIEETQQQAEVNIQTDPFVIELQNRFNAQIVPGSIEPKINNS